jgi:CarD family transcriptional regulator
VLHYGNSELILRKLAVDKNVGTQTSLRERGAKNSHRAVFNTTEFPKRHRVDGPRDTDRLRVRKTAAKAKLNGKDRTLMSAKKTMKAAPAKVVKVALKGPVKAAVKPAAKLAPKVEVKKPELKAVPKVDLKVAPKPTVAAQVKVEPKLVASHGKPVVAAAPVAAKVVPPKPKRPDFRTNDWVVYPAHGVGRIIQVVEQEVAGMKLELFVINFDKDKMTLRVPVAKASLIGMRRLSSPDVVANALQTLKGRARIKRTMWSRRAQEYEAKINSGDLISIAEVVRDLHRASGQPEQSYSERQLYEAALGRMAREVAAVERIDEDAAVKRLEVALQRAA